MPIGLLVKTETVDKLFGSSLLTTTTKNNRIRLSQFKMLPVTIDRFNRTRWICLTCLLLISTLCLYQTDAWNLNGDIINADNSLFNLDLFDEGSGSVSDESSIIEKSVPPSTSGEVNKKDQIVASLQHITERPALIAEYDADANSGSNVESKANQRFVNYQFVKGEKGEQGEKGECVYDSTRDQSLYKSCSCNISQIIDEFGEMPRGMKGDTGPKGPPGPIGFPGIPGPPGPPGPPARGNVFDSDGTFIDPSITYMAGRIGETGPPGPRGLPGHKGEKGDYSIGAKGDKGERGKKGKNGKPGIRGPPGDRGLPGPKANDFDIMDLRRLVAENEIKGIKGEIGAPGLPGPPGPPGPVIYDSWSENVLGSKSRHYRGRQNERSFGGDSKSDNVSENSASPMSVVCNDIEELHRLTAKSQEGTLAFLIREQVLLVRIKQGWRYVMLGSTLQTSELNTAEKATNDATTYTPPSSSSPSISELETLPNEDSRHVAHNRKLRVAALNQPFVGDMHGVRGVDYECFRQSRRANLKGTFRAFVASRVQNLESIVRPKDAKLPVVNLRDEILFNSWQDIFTGAGAPFPYPPKIYSFDGRNIFTDSIWPQKLIWHGADKNGVRNTDAYCDAWNSNSISRLGVASNLLRGKLLDQEKYSCNNAFIVLCVEVTPDNSPNRHRKTDAN